MPRMLSAPRWKHAAKSELRAAIEPLKTFAKTHGLSLGDMTLQQLRREARHQQAASSMLPLPVMVLSR